MVLGTGVIAMVNAAGGAISTSFERILAARAFNGPTSGVGFGVSAATAADMV